MEGFRYSILHVSDPLFPVVSQGHLVVVELIGKTTAEGGLGVKPGNPTWK